MSRRPAATLEQFCVDSVSIDRTQQGAVNPDIGQDRVRQIEVDVLVAKAGSKQIAEALRRLTSQRCEASPHHATPDRG